MWGKISRYVELNGMHGGDGNVMGLAAAKVGWTVDNSKTWKGLKKITKHLDASHQRKASFWGDLQRRLAFPLPFKLDAVGSLEKTLTFTIDKGG